MLNRLRPILLLWPLLLGLIVSGCGQTATPTPPPPTSTPTATSLPSPSPTPTLTPTAVPSPTPTPTFTPTPSPTPAPQPITANTLGLLKPQIEQPWSGYYGLLTAIAWSPDGSHMAGQLLGGVPRVVVWETQNLQQTAMFPKTTFHQWLSDGRMLVSTPEGQYFLINVEQEQQEPVDLTPFGDNTIKDLRISPTGRYVIALAPPRTVLVYDTSTQTLQRYDVPRDKEHALITLDFGTISADENWLFLRGRSALPIGAFTVVFNLHQQRLYSIYPGFFVSLSPNNNRALILDNAISVKVAFTGEELTSMSGWISHYDPQTQHSDRWSEVATDFASQTQLGMLLAHANPPFDAQLILRDIGSREVVKTLQLPQIAGAAKMAFSPDRSRFATASHDGYLRIWDLEGHLLAEARVADNATEGFGDELPQIKISPSGEKAAKADGFQGIALFTLPNSKPDFVLPRPEQDDLVHIPTWFKFVNDHLLTLSMPEGVYLWDLDTQQNTHTYMQGAAWWPNCEADAQGDLLLCGARFLALVDGETQEIIAQLGDSQRLRSKAIQPQGQFVALCERDSDFIALWHTDPLQHRPNLLLTLNGKPTAACGTLVFSQDGRYLISGAGGIWDVESSEQVGEFPPLRNPPAISGGPNDLPPMQIGSGPNDFFWVYDPANHNLVLYRLPTGQKETTLVLPEDTLTFRFTSDGMRFLVMQTDRITTWQAVP